MALTSNDETDLLLPLYQGIMETPRFALFLDRLKRRTRAAHVSIASHRAGALFNQRDVSFAGVDLARHGPANSADLPSSLRPYRVYTLAELAAFGDFARQPERFDAKGIADMRVVRIRARADGGGMLCLARSEPCTAADSALLSNLAPYAKTALTMLHAMERDRFEAALSGEGLMRSGTGWILFDADARIVAIEAATQRRLAQANGTEQRIGERLHAIDADTERKLASAAMQFAADREHLANSSVVIRAEPRIDAVLVPIGPSQTDAIGHVPDAVMVAYCRFEILPSQQRAGHFARLFDLPAREAELAIALADGHSIAEAASAMGLTLETARNYSKRLYAQLGVRGQAGLVRLVHRSSAVLA